MKRLVTLILSLVLLSGCTQAFADQMEDGVPVWTEETVRQYALDYISGTEMTRLWNYYDLQIRRYLPQQAFENFLIDLEFLTGDFQALGSYTCFEVPEEQWKTHVLHLCMTKQDVDMYFSHKDKEDDWEIMALEFIPSNEEPLAEGTVGAYENVFSEEAVIVGTSSYPLEGILTLPVAASAENQVPVCIFVHDFGPHDRDLTIGETKMFKDFADELAEIGIASLRYDKRTYAYPDAEIATVWDEVVEDVIAAVNFVKLDNRIDQKRVVVAGLGLGAMLTPRIAAQSEGSVTGMMMIGGTLDSILNIEFQRADEYLAELSEEELSNEKYIIRNFKSYDDEKVKDMSLLGRPAMYYRDAETFAQVKTIRSLAIPCFIAQGKRDTSVLENDGRRAYYEQIGNANYMEYESFRGLNHLLMDDLSVNAEGVSEYCIATHVDKYAARTLGNWVLSLYQTEEE